MYSAAKLSGEHFDVYYPPGAEEPTGRVETVLAAGPAVIKNAGILDK